MKSLAACLYFLVAAVALAFMPTGRGQTTPTLTTLCYFPSSGAQGAAPYAALVQGKDGNFYGTASNGGAQKVGTVFKCTPAGNLTVVHSFTGSTPTPSPTPPPKTVNSSTSSSTDGAKPGAELVQYSDGNFYGTTNYGGSSVDGTVFTMTTAGAFNTLYSFTGGSHGAIPAATLVPGSDGTFYGTTLQGSGGSDNGTIFSITTAGVLTTLHSFTGIHASALVKGSDGNFYGTTSHGGDGNVGTIFSITPAGVCTTLHSFSRVTEGAYPNTLVLGSDGNFYGTASYGGKADAGTIFSFTPTGAFTALYSFGGSTDGTHPESALVQASDGNFYGTTNSGGSTTLGTLFSITPAGALATLHTFAGGTDGAGPYAALIQGSDGCLYGTTAGGDSGDYGTVFKLDFGAVPAHPPFFTGEVSLSNGVYYLSFADGNYFGYYSYLTDPRYIYHFDLGYEYIFDANDGKAGVYFYDFQSNGFFYTNPTFPFPYLYDFTLSSVLYYYADPNHPGHYNTNGVRYFYEFKTGKIISK